MELTGKIAVVTGASSGIGLAAAKALYSQGASVVLLARDEQNLQNVIQSMDPDSMGRLTGIATDVRDEASVQNAIEQTISLYGQIDILINAAGVSLPDKQLVQDVDLNQWKRIMETNLTGTFLMSREALLRMNERNSGYIINILSTSAFQASGGDSIYAASKYGARALTESMISANRRSGIRISSISPGAVNTNIWSHKTKPVSQETKDTMLKPEDIGEMIVFLVTRPSYVHIENMTVTSWLR
ncbi:SDR family oxidoreductase [Paenibacillus sp. RC67]|uniref:SDR family oxidoreductase n=1 Tax=Paenibacillus sp. RC67 TaxID=3039392 RepID=UPI0024ACA13A|nr:SDR family oxidoreductase [Paenibacillus sp. RC67]